MIRIAYRSTANNPDLALIALADIIATSDRNNRRDGLTGALLVSKGRFFQILEGATVDVQRTLARIAADPRHHDIVVVAERDVTERLFEGWSMVAARVTPSVAPEIDRAIDDCVSHPSAAIDAVLDLVSRQHTGGD